MASPTYLSTPSNPNDLWSVDFKGQFRLQNRRYCYPLTVSDQVSRFILACEGMEGTRYEEAQVIFEEVFKEYGLPTAIRSDNGEPFSSRSIWGLSALSVWWLRLGIKLERIRPGHPEENGRHERMHRTLKLDTASPSGGNLLQQQEKFDKFVSDFNKERPHESLQMRTPSELYQKSSRVYPDSLPEIDYEDQDIITTVSKCGSIRVGERKRIFISTSLRGQPLGVSEVEAGIWLVKFMDYDLGYFAEDERRLTVAESPFSYNLDQKV